MHQAMIAYDFKETSAVDSMMEGVNNQIRAVFYKWAKGYVKKYEGYSYDFEKKW